MERRIEICGGIAAGKSTLTNMLESNGFSAVYERFEDNPFLKEFYQKGHDNALETELVFLLLHYNQLKGLGDENIIVSDYSLLQDYSYALQNMQDDEVKVFDNVYQYLSKNLSPVDLVIYLKCGIDCLLRRICERKREDEKTISKEYLCRHIEVLEKVLQSIDNVLIIDSENYDFRGRDKNTVLDMIKKAIDQL